LVFREVENTVFIIMGFVVALFPMFVLVSDMKNVKMNNKALGYENGKIHIFRHEDRFIRKDVTVTHSGENGNGSHGMQGMGMPQNMQMHESFGRGQMNGQGFGRGGHMPPRNGRR